MIADRDGMQSLASLELGRRPGQFSIDLLRHIAQSKNMSKLTTIAVDLSDIVYNQSVDQALLDFFLSLTRHHKSDFVESVLFFNVTDSQEWLAAFVSSPNCGKLKTFILRNCNLTDSSILAIAQSRTRDRPKLHSRSPKAASLEFPHFKPLQNPAPTDDSAKYLIQSEVLQLMEFHPNDNQLLLTSLTSLPSPSATSHNLIDSFLP